MIPYPGTDLTGIDDGGVWAYFLEEVDGDCGRGKTDGNGSPATGPGVTGKIECVDVSGGKGAAYLRAVLSRVLAQG